MPFIYVTGPAGSGKSSILKELRSRGIDAYDEDESGVGSAHNKLTQQTVSVPPAHGRAQEWFARHEWKVLSSVLDELKNRSKNSLVILCGNSLNDKEIKQLFDKVIYLQIDEDSLRQRIAARPDNDYGKNDHELQAIISRYRVMNEMYSVSNSVKIDATQPIEKVVSNILSAVSTL